MSHNDENIGPKLLLSIHEHVVTNKADIAEIKVDIREHIRRTNILESKVNWIERLLWMGGGGSTVIYFILKLTKVI